MESSSLNEVQVELESVEAELEVVEQQIAELLERQGDLNSRKKHLLRRLEQACVTAQPSGSSPPSSSTKLNLKHYEGTEFPWSKEVQKQLSDVFHLPKFRPLQQLVINLTMSGKDVFLVMPTGRGKSLCYQLPAVCSEGFTLVIAPLVSLMEDQLMYLTSIGVPAVSLNASCSKEQSKWVLSGMTEQKTPFKLLYVTPEKIAKSKLLMSKLEKAYNAGKLHRIAVDETHCCSQWGHDFRPDYKLLGILKRQFPTVPLLGLTATATSSVLMDCQKILCVPEPVTLTASFNRPNLYYEVRIKEANLKDSTSDIVALIKERYKDKSGIIYVFSQKDADCVAAELQEKGIAAQPYHAGMEPAEKSRVHKHWTSNKVQVVVATVAFGMGIDKSDVRFVIHHSLSKSMENYYQESGRAGRDDKPADCILYFGFADIFRISVMVVMENVGQQKLRQMVAYCQNVNRCRRVVMAGHFDEVWDDDCNQMCDICRHGNDYVTVDITRHAREVLQVLEAGHSLNERMTPVKVVETWMGKGPAKRRKNTQVTKLSRLEVDAILIHLLLQGYLSEDFSFTPHTTFFYMKQGRKAALLKDESHVVTMKMKRAPPAGDPGKKPKRSGDRISAQDDASLVGVGQNPLLPADSEDHTFHENSKFTKNQQNQATKQYKTQADGQDSDEPPRVVPAPVQPDANKSEGDGAKEVTVTPVIQSNSKRKSTTPKKTRRQPPAEAADVPPVQQGSAMANAVSEVSIISAAAAAELCDLRRYYGRQLQKIDYASHETLQDSESGVVTCSRAALKSLRLPWGASIARSARSLWTRVSTRRRILIRR